MISAIVPGVFCYALLLSASPGGLTGYEQVLCVPTLDPLVAVPLTARLAAHPAGAVLYWLSTCLDRHSGSFDWFRISKHPFRIRPLVEKVEFDLEGQIFVVGSASE